LTEFSDDEEPKPKKPVEPIYETKEEADYQLV
jgi:hypothetical protein